MDFTVSALSFVGPKMKWMAQLPKDMGIEIFWEYGSEDYWKQMLPVLLSERSGAFSIHGPSVCEDISQAGNTEAIMKRLCRPFDVYHQFHSRFYVLHTNGKMPPNLTPEESAQRRAIALERIAAFQERCTASDVTLVVENVNGAPGIPPLFSQTDFLDIFKQLPDLLCLLDMKRNCSKLISLCLALCMMLSLAVCASAAEIDTSGGSGTTPVSLTTTNGGIGGGGDGDITPTKLNVTVPTTLPLAMSDEGTVVTATDCKITNFSYGAVRVKSVTISAAANWHLTKFGDKSLLAAEKVDSNKLGFALAIGGGKQVQTATNEQTQALITAPVDGCYMTGVGDLTGNTAKIDYAAIVTPLSNTMKNATVANVVFVIEWDTVA